MKTCKFRSEYNYSDSIGSQIDLVEMDAKEKARKLKNWTFEIKFLI